MKREIINSEAGSNYIGTLPLGCQMCMRGQKMVLFIGGKCDRPKRCSWYCPISEKRRDSEQMYADEIKIDDPMQVIREAKLIQAKGCSFTGGDPLGSEDHIELTLFYLEELKREFSNDFHIHLYTNGRKFNPSLAQELANAGLDEIRFHPAEEDFHKIQYAMDLGMDVGAEIPVIPNPDYEKYIWNLIDYLDTIGANFINLNQFEINEPNHKSMLAKGFELEEGSMAAVKGSRELAQNIISEFPEEYMLSLHYCPISLKDGPQLRNRYKRRAESIKKPFEEITDDGTLMYLKVEGAKKKLNAFYRELLDESGVPQNMMELHADTRNSFLYLPWFLSEEGAFSEAIKEYRLKAGIVEILPFRGEYSEICEYTPVKV